MNSKREIPVSACPTDIEDRLYGLSSPPGSRQSRSEQEVFSAIPGASTTPKPARRKETRFDRWMVADSVHHFKHLDRCVVGTDNVFTYRGKKYRIDVTGVPSYAPNDHGMYGMDHIICGEDAAGELHFFDQDLFDLPGEFINETA